MVELSPETIAIIMFAGVLVGVLSGYPFAMAVGTVALVCGYAVWGPTVAKLLYVRMFGLTTTYVLLAVPLFVFMGAMIERSGTARAMYDALYLWLGGIKGGLASVTVVMGTIIAATVGVIGASISMLGLIALPSMIRRGYNKSLASGTVCAAGCLGILIPPSVMLVVYGPSAGVSVGKLFMGAFMPGFLLSALYIVYISIRCAIRPEDGPPVPPEERRIPLLKKTAMLAYSIVPPAILILSVLGTIYLGIAPATEAAGIGAFVATLLAIFYRRLNWNTLKESALDTVKVSSMIFLVASMAFMFTGVFIGAGCGNVVKDIVLAAPGGTWGIFGIIMLIVFILGFFLDWIGIVLILVPIVTPIIVSLKFDPVWFAMMFCVNLQCALMTPPFAPAIFFLRGVAPPELKVSMAEIISGVMPFVVLILVGLLLCVAFPEIILWLPSRMIK